MSKVNKVSIGAFNLYIGFAMICVVLVHTIELFSEQQLSIVVKVLFEALSFIGVAGFAVISGYKLKVPRDLKSYIKKISKEYLKMYYLFGAITVVLFSIIHLTCFRYIQGTIKETILLLIGFAFAVYPAIPIGDVVIYSCGPLYFIVAFLIAEILTVIILNSKFQLKEVIILALMLMGSILLDIFPGCPFALTSAMLLTGCFYTGFMLKEKQFFEKKRSFIVLLFAVVISAGIYCLKYITFFEKIHLLIEIIAGIIAGTVLVYLCVVYSGNKNRLFSLMKKIGRVSFFVLGAHTIEYFAIPWYLVVNKISVLSPELGVLIIYIVRLIIIFTIVKISEYLFKKRLLRS